METTIVGFSDLVPPKLHNTELVLIEEMKRKKPAYATVALQNIPALEYSTLP